MRVLRIRTAVLGAATLLALSTMAEGAAGGPKAASSGATQIVDVSTPTRADRARLQTLGLDLTEHGDADSLEVVLYGDADARRLRDAGFAYTVRVADLAALDERNRKADEAYAAATAASPLPSGRDSYRHLTDYEQELASLATTYPGLSRPITLPHPSLEGRPVVGIEITQNPAADDGKPVFVLLGTHHAREWPSAEMTLEFGYDLLRNYGTDARTTRLVNTVRTIVVPVVNPDGFNVSREARTGPPPRDFSAHDFEMKRKNCRGAVGTCDQQSRLTGVDPNRNYAGFWGGSGASPLALDDTYRGSAPFSEPEVQNIKELVGSRPVTALITNHTFGNLVLRPPGVYAAGLPHEEPIMAELGARMASRNGYANLPGWGLYDTSGTTEDWTFWTAGALSYTFEMGPDQFHPPYETGVVAEYLGLPPAAGAGHGGNRAAFYDALEAAADPALHSVLTGSAPAGSRLSISKSFQTSTSPVCKDIFCVFLDPPRTVDDSLSSEMVTTGSTFTWNVNPSTRPSVAGRLGRDPLAPPQATIPMVNDPSVVPDENIYFPGSGPSRIRVPYETFQFEVKGPPEADNDHLTVHIEWTDPADDWDVYVVNASNQVVAQSAVFGDADEDALLPNPAPGTYTAYIVNYNQVRKQSFDDWRGEVRFAGPPATTTGVKEAWTFRCQAPSGATAERQVTIDRGQSIDLGAACPAA